MAIKLDMSKAYDRIEWPFLRAIMIQLGFKQHLVDLMMRCVQSTSFAFIVNGAPTGHIIPSKGMGQGDPISPYLFLFCNESLSSLLKNATEDDTIRGYQVCHNTKVISHFLFANDTKIFCGAKEEQAIGVKHLLWVYEVASGQSINLARQMCCLAKV